MLTKLLIKKSQSELNIEYDLSNKVNEDNINNNLINKQTNTKINTKINTPFGNIRHDFGN